MQFNFVLSAALEGGTLLSGIIIFLILQLPKEGQLELSVFYLFFAYSAQGRPADSVWMCAGTGGEITSTRIRLTTILCPTNLYHQGLGQTNGHDWAAASLGFRFWAFLFFPAHDSMYY